MKRDLLKPKDIARLLGIKVSELIDIDVDRISSDSLNKLSDENPKKYQLQMLGVVCTKLDISVEEIVLYSKQRDENIKLLEKRANS